MERPVPKYYPQLDHTCYSKLKNLCEAYLTLCETGSTADNDLETHIFEVALEIMYGENVWDYINKHLK